MPKQQQLVYLSDEQFQTLVAQGSITVNGQTVEYSEDDIYVTPQEADELNNKANRDGYYSEMTVGNAEQLVSSKFVEDQEPYTLRASGGSADIGNRENLTAIVGGTLAWNQQVRDEASDNVTEFADIVTVDDAVADAAAVKVKIEPVQDLHGYDHPWPAGGGKNLLDFTRADGISAVGITATANSDGSITLNGTATSAGNIYLSNYTFTAKANQEYTLSFELSGTYTLEGTLIQIMSVESGYAGWTVGTGAPTRTRSFTSDTLINDIRIHINAGDSYTNAILKVQFEEGSTATAWTPYENICPITGWTGANISRTNKVISEWRYIHTQSVYSQSMTYTEDGVALRQMAESLKPGTYKYGISFENLGIKANKGLRIVYTDALINFGITLESGQTGYFVGDITIPEGLSKKTLRYATAYAGQNDDGTPPTNAVIKNLVITMSDDTPTEDDVITKAVIPVTFPSEAGTVYGCELTVNKDGSGSLVVTHVYATVSSARGISTKPDGSHFWYTTNSDLGIGIIKGLNAGFACDRLYATTIVTETSSDGAITCYENGIIRWKEPSSSVPSEYNAFLSENPFHFVYELATPVTYPLTASQVTTLLGTNNIWSDAGQVSLTYTGTDEHLTLTDGRKYMTRINGVDGMVLGAGQALTAVKGRDNVFDLTQMFGAANVADYVYGQGAGYFRKWFPNSVYAYDVGTLKSVEGLQSHDTVGFNLLDADTVLTNIDFTKLEDGSFYAVSDSTVVNKNVWTNDHNIAGSICIAYTYKYSTEASQGIRFKFHYTDGTSADNYAPASTAYTKTMYVSNSNKTLKKITITYGSAGVGTWMKDICISLAHNNSRNGEYEPYENHSYPLDSSLTLRGIPKAGANGIYWDGDQYKPDGTVERRYKLLTLTGNEQYNIADGVGYIKSDACDAYINIADCSYPFASATPGYISDHNLKPMSNMAIWSAVGYPNTFCMNRFQLHLNISNDLIGVTDYTKETRTTALQKIQNHIKAEYDAGTPYMFILPLAELTTETAEPYRELQQVDDWGTEEFVTTGLVPVGHETQYPANLRDKLQHLPDLASSNGIYIVKQTDSEMELFKLPDMPTANGNYRLKLNVASGSPTFSWEAVT